jgi:alanyl aminopeptidase
VTGNYDRILDRIPKENAAFLPEFAGGCSAERLRRAEGFFSDERHVHPGTSKEMAKVAEQVRDCLDLRGREGAAVTAWLQSSAQATAESGP